MAEVTGGVLPPRACWPVVALQSGLKQCSVTKLRLQVLQTLRGHAQKQLGA